jgi:putative membrane-bound dehydrogenase-like protein
MTRRLLPLLAVSVAYASGSVKPAAAQVPPDKAEATFKVVDGLQLSVWASEETAGVPRKKDPNDPKSPTVVDSTWANPTCIDVDHLGRVWVCESVNYRCKLHGKPLNRPEGDRIVILEDTTGSGKADKVTTFYQSPELLAPLGIAVAKDPVGPGWKVFVCQSPDILVFTDSKGTGKADGPPKKLLTGFRGIDHDHGVHGILIGPDMKLYFSVGDQGVSNLQSADGKGRKWTTNDTDCQKGTIWRCSLDGTGLELLAHNFRNEYEPCVDSFGTIMVSDNDDDGSDQTRICYVMPGGNYGYGPRGPGQTHWHEEQPGVVPKLLRTFRGSPTGMCFYEGTLLPKKYWGQPLHTDAGPGRLSCYFLKPKGAGYHIEREDMVTSKDPWFRPSDVCVAPDGSVFVADWYDPGVGGHGVGDLTRGRIYRITPKGHVGYKVPAFEIPAKRGDFHTILKSLGSPNRAVQYMAGKYLQDNFPRDQGMGMLIWAARLQEGDKSDQAEYETSIRFARSEWLASENGLREFLIRRHKEGNRNIAVSYPAKASDEQMRDQLVSIRSFLGGYSDLASLPDHMLKAHREMSRTCSPAIRREILLALRNSDPKLAKEWIVDLAKLYDGHDRFYLEAIGIAVGHFDKERREIILADFEQHFPDIDEKTLDLIWELRPPSVMPKLTKMVTDPQLTEAKLARIMDILAASEGGGGKALLAVLRSDVSPEIRDKTLGYLRRLSPKQWAELRTSNELLDTLNYLLSRPERRLAFVTLIAAAELTDAAPKVAIIASIPEETVEVRKAAIQALGTLPSAVAVEELGMLLNDKPPALRVEAAQALGKLSQPRGKEQTAVNKSALAALQAFVRGKSTDAAARTAAVTALSGTRAGTIWLLDRAAANELPDDVKGETARLLRNSPYPDLRRVAMTTFPPPGKIDLKKLPSIPALMAKKGNAERGKLLMAASAKNDMLCLKCHSVRGTGGHIGPDLSMIGKKGGRDNLFESILYPSKAIADQYVAWQIETKKGIQLVGLIVEETKDHVLLRDANGKDHRIAVADIDERKKSPKSLMPEDLVVYMTEENLVDIVEYLTTLQTPALTVDSWHIIGPFDNGDADKGLDVAFAPEKVGYDADGFYPGKSGKVVWRKVTPDATGYVDLQAFYAPNSNNIVSYLYREVESPADQEATLLIGSDDCHKVWLNGALVHTNRVHRAAVPEQDTVKVKLKKGTNRILFKITNGDGAHGLYFTVVSEQELK